MARSDLSDGFASVALALRDAADPQAAAKMAAYMRDQFEFLGVKSAQRRELAKPLRAATRAATGDQLCTFAERCWAQPEREFLHVACDALRHGASSLSPSELGRVRTLIETHSWWDTVDALAVWTVGPMVLAHRELGQQMDRWASSDNLWVARTAILHQLSYKGDTNVDRLFAYAKQRSDHTDFFIRKAIGWSLRQYARTDPAAVLEFVTANKDRFSPLTVREALKHLDRS